ncbi:helix-turn-helix transcriptional regulator [Sulfitobacter sp. F26169L]|uniref:helix-turn-helix domain-containing protein n=1 Tax=Sulfitobacter sp. F26169L TaxID=2996015 RepID=UPI0022608525|nr:helix-turn-helix transcriptional regulator [Sulfitobacter sp. F26169L]MCX7567739.1 helix-turn-helix transcriptional regulator [Sulfitobacter sp. F26169L]
MSTQFRSPVRMEVSDDPLAMLSRVAFPDHFKMPAFDQFNQHLVNNMTSFKADKIGSKGTNQEIASGIHLPANVTLAPREKDVLLWAANGKSAWETAILLELTENTVKFYIRKACSRLGAQNKTHAVAICLAHDLLKD